MFDFICRAIEELIVHNYGRSKWELIFDTFSFEMHLEKAGPEEQNLCRLVDCAAKILDKGST